MITSDKICKSLSIPHFGKAISLSGFTTIDQPKLGSILFLKNSSSKSIQKLSKHSNSMYVLPESLKINFQPNTNDCAYIFHPEPRKIFFEIIDKFFSFKKKPSIHPSVFVDKNVKIGMGVNIEQGVSISGSCRIEDGVSIGSNVLIIGPCQIGKNSVISSGVIIGEESLSIRSDENLQFQNPQLGGVIIGKNCRIGVFSTISRGSLGDTILENNVFMGEYSHVGHNSYVASHSVLTIRSSICGSVRIEKPCWLGPHAVILNGVTIREEIKLGAGSILHSNAKKQGTYFGNPAKLLDFKNKKNN